MAEKKPTDPSEQDIGPVGAEQRGKPKRPWADEAAKARTADDPRARTPRDSSGQPSTRSLDE
jgi:hypothetical protein